LIELATAAFSYINSRASSVRRSLRCQMTFPQPGLKMGEGM